MNALVINLNRSKDRMNFMSRQLDRININFERVQAVDANDLDFEFYQKHAYSWNRVLRRSEIACFFSHKKAWEIVANKDEPFMIFEDDVVISKTLVCLVDKIEDNEKYNFINLETSSRKKLIHKKKESITDSFSLKKVLHNKTGAAAYILWPKCARFLLSNYEKKGAALADAALYDNYFKLQQYQLTPAVAVQAHQCANFGINKPFKHASNIASEPKPRSNKSFYLIFKLRRIKTECLKLLVYIWYFGRSRLMKIGYYIEEVLI